MPRHRSPWFTFRPVSAARAALAALVAVPVLALVTKALVEGLTSVVYQIHGFETVPFLVVLFFLVLPRPRRPPADARRHLPRRRITT